MISEKYFGLHSRSSNGTPCLKNRAWSILLYVIFLCSFLILFFASFQWEVEKVLQWSDSFENSVLESSTLHDVLDSLPGRMLASQNINETLVLSSLDYNGSAFSGSLGNMGTTEYRVTNSGGVSTFTLNITEGAPILYRLAAFNSGDESNASIVSSGVANVNSNTPITLSGTLNRHILYLESLGGHAKYALSVGSATVLPPTSIYHLVRNINDYKKSEGNFEVTHFLPRAFMGIDYAGLWMYLKN